MPSSDNGRIQITRIRLSTTRTSSLDYFFRSERNQESLGNTRSLTGVTCTLPGNASHPAGGPARE